MSAEVIQADVVDSKTGEVLSEAPVSQNQALQPLEKRGIVLSDVKDIDTMSLRLAKSDLVPVAFRGKPADVFLALNFGLELGLSPVASLRAIHVVEGRPSLAADAMVGIIMASGAARYFECIQSDEKGAIYEAQRVGSPRAVRKQFTPKDAERAGLLKKDNHAKYPIHMMEARCKAHLARDLFPDVLHGIYCPEELEAMAAATPRTVLDDLKDVLLEAKTKADLDSVGQRAFAELSSKEQDLLRPFFKRMQENIKAAEAKAKADPA